MFEYNKVNVKLSDEAKICHQKSGRSNFKNDYENVWWKKFTSCVIIDNKTKTKLRNAFGNNLSADIMISKTQISKLNQSRGF